jgi:23S rRNA pseudouridine2605 synthase
LEERLQTILSHAGVSSRRGAVELIGSGKVTVDGKVTLEKGLRLDPDAHDIRVGAKPIAKKVSKKYFLFNKPKGVITTVRDTHDRPTVVEFFSKFTDRLYPVGRLDMDTTGLIIVTNDGALANKLMHPRYGVEKEYRVAVRGDVSPDEVRTLSEGVEIESGRTSPCHVDVFKRFGDKTLLTVTIHEGKKRQVRYMFKAIGKYVTKLDRVKYAGISIGDVKRGFYRPLTEKEIQHLVEITEKPVGRKPTGAGRGK